MFDEKENFPGEKQIADMLSSLKRVDVPGDFDTRVRARIARGEANERFGEGARAWTTNLVRIGASVAAVIAVALGGYFAFTLIDAGQKDVPPVAEVQPMIQTPIVAPPTPPATNDNQAEEQIIIKPSDEMMADKINNFANTRLLDELLRNGKDKANTNSTSDRPSGGSRDLAVRESQRVYPRGLNPNAKAPANALGVDPNARIPVSSILEFIGVNAKWGGEGCRVESIAPGSIAERSGLKSGDVIEAINGQTVDKKTTFPAKFDGTSLRVRRDGVSLSVDFKL